MDDAREYLYNLSYKLGSIAMEYLSDKDGEKMREAIDALEQTKWIPCSERLPEGRMYCLITVEITPYGCSPSYEVQTSWFDGRNFIYKTYIDDCIVAKRGVIAWMPQPGPYKEESEEVETQLIHPL
jgi:hypothetical protein